MKHPSKPPAAEINPYAAPQAADPRERYGVGAWRTGPLLVMHIAAPLPRVCIVTGEQAAGAREWQAVWKSPGSLLKRYTFLYLPLRRDLLDKFAKGRWWAKMGILMGVSGLVLLATLSAVAVDWNETLALAVALVNILLMAAGILVWSIALATIDEPLKIVRSSGDYLWLSGASEKFLAQLPEAPIE